MYSQEKKSSMSKITCLTLLSMIACLLSTGNSQAAKIRLQLQTVVITETGISLSADTTVFTVCSEMPKYPGGETKLLSYLTENIKYPVKSIEKKEQGRVIVDFIVEKDGSLSNIHVLKSITPRLDAEAIRVVKSMPKWIPGKQRGKSVRVKYTCPIIFKMK